jgi:hypothetical protein
VSHFRPDGYLPAPDAMFRAAGCWFPKQWDALWEAAAPRSATNPDISSSTKPDNNIETAVRAFSQSQIPAAWQDDNWRNEFKDIWRQTAHRLRNFLHQDTIKAYYFDNDGCQVVACNFWPIPAADGVLETGIYWPFGRRNTRCEQPPSYPLFLKQLELDALLSEQPAGKTALPRPKMPDLVAALRAPPTFQTVKNNAKCCATRQSSSDTISPTRCYAKRRNRCRANPVASLPVLNNNWCKFPRHH